MTGLVIVPHLEMSRVEWRGILTVPSEDATVSCACRGTAYRAPTGCWGLPADNLPLEAHALGLYVYEMGKKFVRQMEARGYAWLGDLRLHGPYPSYELNQRLVDVEAAAWREAERQDDPSLVLPFIIERSATSPYSDYLVIGQFIVRNHFIEVPDGFTT